MKNRTDVKFPARDWLDAVDELDAPTHADVELELDMLGGIDAAAHRFGTDDWADGAEA